MTLSLPAMCLARMSTPASMTMAMSFLRIFRPVGSPVVPELMAATTDMLSLHTTTLWPT